jgi:hypothetical protein
MNIRVGDENRCCQVGETAKSSSLPAGGLEKAAGNGELASAPASSRQQGRQLTEHTGCTAASSGASYPAHAVQPPAPRSSLAQLAAARLAAVLCSPSSLHSTASTSQLPTAGGRQGRRLMQQTCCTAASSGSKLPSSRRAAGSSPQLSLAQLAAAAVLCSPSSLHSTASTSQLLAAGLPAHGANLLHRRLLLHDSRWETPRRRATWSHRRSGRGLAVRPVGIHRISGSRRRTLSRVSFVLPRPAWLLAERRVCQGRRGPRRRRATLTGPSTATRSTSRGRHTVETPFTSGHPATSRR